MEPHVLHVNDTAQHVKRGSVVAAVEARRAAIDRDSRMSSKSNGPRYSPSSLSVPMAPLRAEPMRVLVTGAAGQIGYALAPMIARGAMLGPEQTVILHLLDIPIAAQSLEGVRMELVDAAFPLVKGAQCLTSATPAPAQPAPLLSPRHRCHHRPGGCLPRRGRGRCAAAAACRQIHRALTRACPVMVGGFPRKEGMERKEARPGSPPASSRARR